MSIDRDILYNPYNLILLAIATGLSAVFLTPWPFAVGVVAEVVWIACFGARKQAPQTSKGDRLVSTEPTVGDMPLVAVAEGVDQLVLLVKARADASPSDTSLASLLSSARLLAKKVVEFDRWHESVLSEIERMVESTLGRYNERRIKVSGGVVPPDPGETFPDARVIRFGSVMEGVVSLESVEDERGSTGWTAAYLTIGRACLENELSHIAARRAYALYESERDDLLGKSAALLANIKRLNSLARLASNVGCELDMLIAAGRRVADELPTRPARQLTADLSAVLMHATSLEGRSNSTETVLSALEGHPY